MKNVIIKITGVLFLLVMVAGTYAIIGNSGSLVALYIVKKNPYEKAFKLYSKIFKDNTVIEFAQVQKFLLPVSSRIAKVVAYFEYKKWTLITKVFVG